MMTPKVLLIYPSALFAPENDWGVDSTIQPQLIILYSYLKENGITADVLDLTIEIGRPKNLKEAEDFPFKVKKLLSQYSFDIVAISCFTSINYLASVLAARISKEINPHCKVVVGGYHPTAIPDDFFSHEGLFDYIVRNEGEAALLDICNSCHDGENSVPKVIDGTPRDLSRGICLDWEGYRYARHSVDRIGLCFSRGCPFRCSYCAESMIDFRYRKYPVSLALRDIQKAVEAINPRAMTFLDPLFRIDTPFGQELLQALVAEDFKKPIRIFTRVDLLNEERVKLLSKLNIHLWLGLETCSKKMLAIMNKTKTPDSYLKKIEENLRYINEYNIMCDCGFVFNHPGETDETINETFDFLERLFYRQKEVSVELIANPYIYFPGTLDAKNLEYYEKEYGTVVRHKEWWKEYREQGPLAKDILASRGAPEKEIWQAKWDEFIEKFIDKKMTKKVLLFRWWMTSQLQSLGKTGYELTEV